MQGIYMVTFVSVENNKYMYGTGWVGGWERGQTGWFVNPALINPRLPFLYISVAI